MLFCISAARACAADAALRAALAASCADCRAAATPAPNTVPATGAARGGASNCNLERGARAGLADVAEADTSLGVSAGSDPRGRGAAAALPARVRASTPGVAPVVAARGPGSPGKPGEGEGTGAASDGSVAGAAIGAGAGAVWGAGGVDGEASTLGSPAAARWPGGSANRVNLRVARDAHPALSCTVTRGSSMATVVLTRNTGPLAAVSSATKTADRGTGISPTETSADRHSGAASAASRRRPTPKSSGKPSTALACALPKPHAQTPPGPASRATASKTYIDDRFRWRDPKGLVMARE